MKFIAITNDISVKKDEIIAVERNEEGKARIVVEIGTYETNWPYESMLSMLEIPDIEEKIASQPEQMSLPSAYQRPMQYWAG